MKRKKWNLRMVMLFHLAVFAACPALLPAQDAFPSRPVNVVVGWTPGGSTDLGVRIVAGQASNELGASMVILNKPGAGGMVGSEFVRQSKPDGYTLFGASIGIITIPILDPKCPYTIDDFEPICMHDTQLNLVAVRSESQFKSLKEVIEFAKKNPAKLSYGSAGIGSTSHFFGEIFKQATAVDLTHVPFKGDAPTIAALIGGHVDLGILTTATIGHIKGGKIRALVLGSSQRDPELPDVPTVVEMGYPQAVFASWHAFFGPRGMPRQVVAKLGTALEKAAKHPSVHTMLKQIKLTPTYMNAAEFKEFMKKDTERLKDIALKKNMIIKY